MEGHRQALIDTALNHEQVVAFITELHVFLEKFGRPDIEVITEPRLSKDGVKIRVYVKFASLYPGEMARDPEKYHALKQASEQLLAALKTAGIRPRNSYLEGSNGSMKEYYLVFNSLVNYQGEILPL